jgi:addiction module HigA family antidote
LREQFLPVLGVTQKRLAVMLGVSRRTVSEVVNQRRRVTPNMAHRLAHVFRNGPEFWLSLQQAVDIFDSFVSNESGYRRIPAIPPDPTELP